MVRESVNHIDCNYNHSGDVDGKLKICLIDSVDLHRISKVGGGVVARLPQLSLLGP